MEPPANRWRLFAQKVGIALLVIVPFVGKLLLKSLLAVFLVFCALIAASKPRE